jgi:hypothetical protein
VRSDSAIGVETCNGNPAAEAAALAANLKLSFGVNVVGFGVKPEENASLKAIADAGNGKYYSADDANKLAEFVAAIAREIQEVAKPPEVDVSRRAVRVLTPKIEMPELDEISLVKNEEAKLNVYSKLGTVKKYDEYLSIPSSTNKYTVFLSTKGGGWPVPLLRDFSIPERKVVDVRPETILGLVQVNGTGKVDRIYVRNPGDKGTINRPVQMADKFGEIMVVPAGKYDIYVGSSLLEEGLEVQAGKLYRLQ